MMTYSFGDVVLVGFPFTNLETVKKRPAVIINNHRYQQKYSDVILMAITSQQRQAATVDDAILEDWQTAGLVKPSVFKPLIATIEQRRIVKPLGVLSTADQESLRKVIQSILGI